MAKANTTLRVEMARRNLSLRGLEDLIGVHYWRLYKIAKSEAEPTFAEAVAIEAGVGIAVERWPSLRKSVNKLMKLRGAA